MSRTGKIARLPLDLREALNHRLEDAEPASEILEWLNAQTKTKKTLAAGFEGRPITEQNLSEWRQGGFRDWLRRRETRERINRFLAVPDDLNDIAAEQDIPDRLSAILAMELASEVQQLLAETADPETRFKVICQAARSLQILRRTDQVSLRVDRERAEWLEKQRNAEAALQKADDKARIRKAATQAVSPIWDSAYRTQLVKTFGGGPGAVEIAEYMINIARTARGEDPLPPLPPDFVVPERPSNRTQSGQIQPNPT